jgi:hypothetical protein
MPRMTRILVTGTAITLAGACSDPIVPIEDFDLPGVDLSLDPDRLSVGGYMRRLARSDSTGTASRTCLQVYCGPWTSVTHSTDG